MAFWEVAVPKTGPFQARAMAARTRVLPVPAGPVITSTVRAEVSACHAAAAWSSRAGWPGASQPRAPTERSVKVSLYSARPIYRLNLNSVDHFQCANRSGCLSVRSFHHLRTFLYDLSRLYFHFAQRTR